MVFPYMQQGLLSLLDIRKGDKAKSKKGRVVIVYMTRCLVLFYISTKYHKIFQRIFDLQSRHNING